MQMSEFEICRDYEAAKKKNAQIEILADMNLCEPSEIIDVLVKNGKISGMKESKKAKKLKKKHKERTVFTEEAWDEIKRMRDEGVPVKEIAEKLGYSADAIYNKVSYEKKKKKATVCFADTKPKENIDDTYIKELEGIIQEQQIEIGEAKAKAEQLKADIRNAKEKADELAKELGVKKTESEDLQNKCEALEALANDGTAEINDVLNDIELLAKLAYGCVYAGVRMDEAVSAALKRICDIINDVKTEAKDEG